MFRGSMVALVTPMHEDGSLDEPALERLVEFHVENGTDGIVPVGTTGESPTLSHEEHERVIAFVERSEFFLVETLAERVAAIIREEFAVPWVRLRVNKRGALRGAVDVGVEIERGERP